MIINFYFFIVVYVFLLLEWEYIGFGKLVDFRDGVELIFSVYVCFFLNGLINFFCLVKFDIFLVVGEIRIFVENIFVVVMLEIIVGNIFFLVFLD